MKRYEVTFNLGFVSYYVEAKTEDEAINKGEKERLKDGYTSPQSELVSDLEVEK